jgi:iron complex transport system permease protein
VSTSGRLRILLLVALCSLFTSPFLGEVFISPFQLLGGNSLDTGVLLNLRIPRALLAFLIGASLSLSGVVFQAIFRNVLASPFTLGVSSGASVGAAVVYVLPLGIGLYLIELFSLFGALFVSSLIVLLALRARFRSSNHLILAGVVVNFFCSSFVMLLQYFSEPSEVISILRWYMGSLSVVGYNSVLYLLPVFIVVSIVTFRKSTELDLFWFGEELSQSKGLDYYKERNVFNLFHSLLTALGVSFVGPIGFIGIVVPHICRLIFGLRHKDLVPASMLFGGVFLSFCDLVSRMVMAPNEIPVGIVTSLIGAPIFLVLLLKSSNKI